MKYLLSVLILAACFSLAELSWTELSWTGTELSWTGTELSWTKLSWTGTELSWTGTSLAGQALADEHQTNNLDSALFGYWYGESIPLPIGGKMVNSRFTYLFLESGQMYMGPEAAVEKASKNQQGTALDSEVRARLGQALGLLKTVSCW
ncbi:MAG: hypothetical protein GYB58_10740 [Gammaproteobacteria bacterium]|nr:hypothetical protein [Gammaproteobacteria bacterium]